MKKQISLFRVADSLGTLEPNNDPFLSQKSRSNANSAIELDKFKKSGRHIPQKSRIKAFLLRNPGSTLEEISAGTGILQRGTITARFKDLRQEGFDLLDNKGRWSIQKRKTIK